MRVAVVGSHDFHDYSRLKHTLDNMENISMLLSGGAKGADSLAEIYAREKNIELKRLVPDWSTYGRAAGMIRNKDIVAEAEQVWRSGMENPKERSTASSWPRKLGSPSWS